MQEQQQYVDTFGGNGYRFGETNILPRYYPDEKDFSKIVVSKTEDGKKVTKDEVNVIFYGLRRVRVNQYPFKSKKKFPKCFSTNFETPTGGEEMRPVKSCAECSLKDWVKDGLVNNPPECNEVLETIVYDVDAKNYAIISWKKTSLKVWKYIEKLVFLNLPKMKVHYNASNPVAQFVFKLTPQPTTTNGMEHALFRPTIVRELETIEEKKNHHHASVSAFKYLLERKTGDMLITQESNTAIEDKQNTLENPPIDNINDFEPPMDEPPF